MFIWVILNKISVRTAATFKVLILQFCEPKFILINLMIGLYCIVNLSFKAMKAQNNS